MLTNLQFSVPIFRPRKWEARTSSHHGPQKKQLAIHGARIHWVVDLHNDKQFGGQSIDDSTHPWLRNLMEPDGI